MNDHNPIQYLMQEHEVITGTMPLVNRLDRLWETDPAQYEQSIRYLLDFYRAYADRYHHRKEEDILFEALRELPDFTLDEIIDELESHHESFRERIQGIDAALDESRFQEAQGRLSEYLGLLLDHIAIEDDELFVMAENLFKEQDLENMYFRFLDSDAELGMKDKQDLVNRLDQL
ncbi:MAG TPA: hemerythrin domain-containing protein [Saprospiraceae bacterium]|nr:hemerythrin domain-containing protein [Saprospiraceae bacterium]